MMRVANGLEEIVGEQHCGGLRDTTLKVFKRLRGDYGEHLNVLHGQQEQGVTGQAWGLQKLLP